MKQFSDLGNSDYDKTLKTQINIAFGQWFRNSDYERMQGLLYYGDEVRFYALYDIDDLNIFGIGQTIPDALDDATALFTQSKKKYNSRACKGLSFDGSKDYASDAKRIILADLNTHIGIISFNVERDFLFH